MEVKLYEMDYEKPDLTDEFLEHHGIKGQKWGVRNGPPYPLSAGKSRKVKETYGGVFADRKKKKRQLKNLEKARAQRVKNIQERKETAQTKEEIIKNRDAAAMLKNIDKFSTKEIQDFNNREEAINKLAIINKLNVEANKSKTEKVKDFVKKNASGAVRDAIASLTSGLVKMGVKKLLSKVNAKLNSALEKGNVKPINIPEAQRDKEALSNNKIKGELLDELIAEVKTKTKETANDVLDEADKLADEVIDAFTSKNSKNSKKALNENQDMFNDLLYNVKYSTKDNKKEANKEYTDALKEVANRYDVNYRYLDKRSKEAFKKREDEIKRRK